MASTSSSEAPTSIYKFLSDFFLMASTSSSSSSQAITSANNFSLAILSAIENSASSSSNFSEFLTKCLTNFFPDSFSSQLPNVFMNTLRDLYSKGLTTVSSTSAPIYYKYDLFLSFRVEDTRNSFTDHLYEALRKAGMTTFRDDDEIREGQELKLEIERSIRESRASIIVISENFANSRWCLDELWLILEQKRKHNHFVLPVFYGVDPSDVTNQRGSFMIKAKEGVEGTKWTQDSIRRWKEALTEVANLKGMVVSGYEKDFIAKIVNKVYDRLASQIHSTPTHLTGIETRAERIISWLRSDKPDC